LIQQGLGTRDWGLEERTRAWRGVLILGALVAHLSFAYAQPQPPELTRPVNDFANVIDPASEAEIERRILALERASGDIVAVATIDTFAPYADIREYAVRMFENRGRGIGAKGKDNGLLILLAVKDRNVWVEVGYDLEQFITDSTSGDVSRNDMRPHFVRGEYGAGLLAGTTRIIGRIAQARGITLSDVPQPANQVIPRVSRVSPWVVLAIIILLIVISNSNSGGRSSRMRRGPPHWGGGSWSGWNSGVGPFGGGGSFGGGSFGGGFGGFGGGRSGGGGGGASW
jgi:uncharacterized protein